MAAATQVVQGPSRNPLGRIRELFGNERFYISFLVIFAFIYAFEPIQQVIRGPLAFLPLPYTNALIVMAYYAVLALGLNIVVGFAGLLDLGYVAFFVFGAYTTAFLSSPHFGLFWPWWFVVVIAVAVAALWGILLGAPTLRLRGDYLAIVTLGFGEIVPALFRILDNVHIEVLGITILGPGFNLTGGGIGINPIEAPVIPTPIGDIVFSSSNLQLALGLALVLLVITFFATRRMRDSRLGRAWMAIREDETAAEAMGINTVSAKLLAFALGASFSGFTGAFVASYQTAIFPDTFKFSISISILIMVILGGMGSIRGAVLGAIIIQYTSQTLLPYLDRFLRPAINSFGDQLGIGFLETFTFSQYNFLLYGVILVVMMIVRPEGLLPSAARKAELHGEGIAAEGTFGTTESVAEAATEFEEAEGALEVPEDGSGTTEVPPDEAQPPGDSPSEGEGPR
jgi:branched-chain amino acid transport system permease protein